MSQRQTEPRDKTQTQKPSAQGTLFWEQTASFGMYSWKSSTEGPNDFSPTARPTSLATRTTSTMEENKNICQSSKCFSYWSPTQGKVSWKNRESLKDFKMKLFQSNDLLIGWNRLFYTLWKWVNTSGVMYVCCMEQQHSLSWTFSPMWISLVSPLMNRVHSHS